jgi:hypothetical protein
MHYFAIAAGFAFAIRTVALGPAKAETMIKSDGKCWLNTRNGNSGWAALPERGSVRHGEA